MRRKTLSPERHDAVRPHGCPQPKQQPAPFADPVVDVTGWQRLPDDPGGLGGAIVQLHGLPADHLDLGSRQL